ncbi:MAG: class I SAM-dependent methyltransferase [Acidobacteriia bacterium]|nr:class I SAM-dependent methyltransferase [Terriglobia bacterium]
MDKHIHIYTLPDYDFAAFDRNMLVLDVGCGNGKQLENLKSRGCQAIGVDPNRDRVSACVARGLSAVTGRAEELPFPTATFDGVICKGVIPYAEPARAFREISRVLKPGAIARFCYLSSGFYLRCLLLGPDHWFWCRLYGLRTLINTWLFATTGGILPQFLGDTTYQWNNQLNRIYREYGFAVLRVTPSPRFAGLPVFIYHELQRNGTAPASSTKLDPKSLTAA